MLTISTGVTAASVDLLLTVGAHITGRAETGVAAGFLLQAGSSVEAGFIRTGHRTDLTVLTIEPLRARAGIIIHQILRGRIPKKDVFTLQGQQRSSPHYR